VILTDESGTPIERTIDDLLPFSFGPDDLRSSGSVDQ
jgi:cytidine deaminase